MPEAKVLGQLLLMQSILNNLPDKDSIENFVCRGLIDIPGVKEVSFNLEINDDAPQYYFEDFSMRVGNELIGKIYLKIEKESNFNLYREYIKNFAFTIGVILHERGIRKKCDDYSLSLKKSVSQRTRELQIEIENRKDVEKKLEEQNKEYINLNTEYRKQNTELIQTISRIQEINNQLEIAKEKAEESDKLKTSFLANMSHEIRTPMNGIMGFAELLKNADLEPYKRTQYLNIIIKSGKRMLGLINDLVEISKIESGQIHVYPEKFSCNEVITGLFDFFLPEAKKRAILLKVTNKVESPEDIIYTDKTRLNQILTNLLKNALKFTAKGKIEFGYNKNSTHYTFYVKDTGIGIPQEMKELIFERFRQLDSSPSKALEGAGLGLAISKAYIEAMGGKIWVESKKNKGAEFYFTVPVLSYYKENIKIEEINTIETNLNSSTFTALIVEDDENSYMFIKELLQKWNVNIKYARNGKEAVNQIQNNPHIDIVLMDIKMPVMDGLVATEIIKQIKPNLPIIVQTAFASESDRINAFSAGCDDYISKPIDQNILVSKMKKLMTLK